MTFNLDQFIDLIQQLSNGGPNINVSEQQKVLTMIYQFKDQHTTEFLILCGQIILLPNISESLAQTAIILIKSVLSQARFFGIDQIMAIWGSIPSEQRTQLKQALVRGIMFSNQILRKSAAATLALIARMEFPVDWPDFLQVLTTLCVNHSSYGPATLVGVLETLSDAFLSSDFIRPRFPKYRQDAKQIVFTLVPQILLSDADPSVKTTAVSLLLNAYKTTIFRLVDVDLRNETVHLLLSIFPGAPKELRQQIYNMFIIFFKRTYDTMFPEIIRDIVTAIAADIQSGDEELQKLGLTFLRKCSKEEYLIFSKEEGKQKFSFTISCAQNFTIPLMQFLPILNPIDMDNDDDDALSRYAYQVLKAFSKISPDIFTAASAFYAENKENPMWNVRCASLLALKSVIRISSDNFPYFQSIMSEITTLAQDPDPTVRFYATSFIATFIKYSDQILPDRNEEIQFIVSFSIQLLSLDALQAISACNIIQKFAERYHSNRPSTPLGNSEILGMLIQALWAQFQRPEIFSGSTKLNLFVMKSLQLLVRNSPASTILVRTEFLKEALNRFQEIINVDQERAITIQSNLLEIIAVVIFSISNCDDFFIDQIFEMLFPLIHRPKYIDHLLSTIGNLIIVSPTKAASFSQQLVPVLIQAQMQKESPQLLKESAMTIGDLFRAAGNEVMIVYAHQFASVLLNNIEDDSLTTETICQLIMALADLVAYSQNATEQLRDRMVIVIRNFTHVNFSPDDPGDVEKMTDILEGIIYLSGSILKVYSYDADFIMKEIPQLFEFRIILKEDVFKSDHIDYSLLLFVEYALSNKQAARAYNVQLNHTNIKNYLKKIIRLNKNSTCREKAKKYLFEIGNA